MSSSGPDSTSATPSRPEATPILTVAVGASAGGLAAFTTFLDAMPSPSGMAFVLIQHLDATRESILDQLLRRHTAMPVVLATDGAPIRADHVYIMPPDAGLSAQNGCLRLKSGSEGTARLRPLDMFFTSLAEDQRERAICIVLSGTGNDGSLGLRVVKEHGGLALAQANAATPAFSAMPNNALGTGLLDAMLAVEEMPAFLVRYAGYMRGRAREAAGAPDATIAPEQFAEVLRLMHRQTGHDFSGYKERPLANRMQRRMGILSLTRPEEYVAKLTEDPAESTRLARDFLIGVTAFFRDPEAFAALRRLLLPTLAAGGEGNPFRVWVPGCATGEEVYSLAIMLREAMAECGVTSPLQIFGSDIDAASIAIARAARYHAHAAAEMAPEPRERWFVKSGEMIEPIRELRETCVFSLHNIIRDPPFSRMNLISCRNLLIYFGADLQDQVLRTFHYALGGDGFLFLGSSEGLTRSQALFTTVDKRNRIFRHSGLLHAPRIRPRQDVPAPPYAANLPRQSAREDWLTRAASRVMARHSPAHVVVDAVHQILRFSGGPIINYLDPAPGLASLGLFTLLRSSLHAATRHALAEASETGRAARQSAVMTEAGSSPVELEVIVEPLSPPSREPPGNGQAAPPFFVVAFDDRRPGASLSPAAPEDPAATAGSGSAAGIDQIEALNEELKLALDEHQLMNEELRSANEELEASREEMQSVNEELQTVNAELSGKNDQLVSLNSDLRNLLDSTQIATLFLDGRLCVKSFTPNMVELFALRMLDTGRPITELSARIDYAMLQSDVEQVLRSLQVIEREVKNFDAHPRVFLMRMHPYRRIDESVDGVVVTFVDITERKQAEDHMWFLAHHDTLTGLPNRAMFHATLEQELAAPRDPEQPANLLYVDLDRFKNVNDAFGHRVGDKLLQLVAARLRRCVRAGDMVYRLGGDEFAIVQRSVQYPDDSTALANRIIATISAPYEIDGHSVQIGVSIGIALCSPDESDAEALLRAADMALYEAKARGRGSLSVFGPEIQQERQRRRAIEVDLREAVARRELTLLFQPIVRVADRRIVGAEALVRWRHASQGLLSPGSFIPIAEEAGLISPIDTWALREACVKAASWPEPVGLSVNLSPLQFAGSGLVEAARGALDGAGLPASRLTLEVTETALLHDDPRTQETVASLRALGVTIAMDDFGTGYSSLTHLRHFPIARIKIDRTFTQSVDSQKASSVIVGAIVAIGAGLGIAVCAEGVETAAQLAAVERLGVAEAQGFFLYRPMPSRELAALLSRQGPSRAAAAAP